MDNAQRAIEAKKAAEQAREEHARAQGAVDQLKKRIKEEYGCKSLKEAEELYQRLKQEGQQAAQACDEAWAAFQKVKSERAQDDDMGA